MLLSTFSATPVERSLMMPVSLTLIVSAMTSLALAGCTVQRIEQQPLAAVQTEVEQAFRHNTGQSTSDQLPIRDRMTALLDSALERAYQSPCDNDVVFYYDSARWGWAMSCDSCLDYAGRPWFYSGSVPEHLVDALQKIQQSGLRRKRYARYSELMDHLGVCPLPPDNSAQRICLERAGWIPPPPDRKWRGESWVVCE